MEQKYSKEEVFGRLLAAGYEQVSALDITETIFGDGAKTQDVPPDDGAPPKGGPGSH